MKRAVIYSDIVIQNPIHAHSMRPAEGFAPTEYDLYRKWLLEVHPRQDGAA